MASLRPAGLHRHDAARSRVCDVRRPSPRRAGWGASAARWRGMLRAALLLVLLLGALPAALPAQDAPKVGELRKVIAVRDAQAAHKPAGVVAAAQAYLADYADGRYADEVLLALAQAQAHSNRPELALQSYNRIIEDFPDSPFREQAMSESLPLLQAQGDQDAAFARADGLVKEYPNSLQRSRVLLWKAETLSAKDDPAGVLTTLKGIDPQQDLATDQEADYYRLQTVALVRSGESAWTPLQRYLKRDDTPEHKAEVLMLVAEVARKADRNDEALRDYQQVVQDYPVKSRLSEALYWRAALFADTRLGDAPQEVRAARRETAIGYYSAYLGSQDGAHRAQALAGRAALQQDAGRLEPALADLEGAVKLDPALAADPKIVRARVTLLKGLGRPQEAVALLAAARGDPALPVEERTAFQVQQAALLYEDKQCDQVEALLSPMPIIADVHLRPRALFMRGFCRYQRQEWEKATFDLEGLINDPDYQNLALPPLLEAYEQSGQNSRLVNLIEELLRAGRVQPSEDLLTRLADGYDKIGEPALMLSAYERLAKLNPEAVKKPAIQLRMGLANERLGRREAAIALYRAVLERPQDDPAPPDVYLTALEHLQGLWLAEGHVKGLRPLHETAAAMVTEPAQKARLAALRRDLDVALARRALHDGKPQEAVKRLEAVLKQTPTEPPEQRVQAASLLMVAYAQAGHADKADALYRAEAEGSDKGPYRAKLAAAVIAQVRGQPETLTPKGKAQSMAPVYRRALGDLPPEQARQRYEAALVLDRAYAAQGDHAARASLVTALLKDGYDDKTKRELHLYQGQIYKDWGKALVDKGDLEGADFQLHRALDLSAEADWRQRYEVVALLSRVQLERKEYTDLVLLNEATLPEIEDPALKAQVRHFLGQVYVQWGKDAEDAGNTKSARIRYEYALDYLPDSDWQRRLAATTGLGKALQQDGRTGDMAAAYEAVLPQVQDAAVKQQVQLYLGRLYADTLKDGDKASAWFKAADQGGKDPLSLEAGYLWADRQLAVDHGDAALAKLKELAGRGIGGTKWEVPIHYRLAVLLHQRKDLQGALAHYRIVAAATGAEVRKLYPRSIAQSKQQVKRIEQFLKSGGGQGGVAVPAVRPD